MVAPHPCSASSGKAAVIESSKRETPLESSRQAKTAPKAVSAKNQALQNEKMLESYLKVNEKPFLNNVYNSDEVALRPLQIRPGRDYVAGSHKSNSKGEKVDARRHKGNPLLDGTAQPCYAND